MESLQSDREVGERLLKPREAAQLLTVSERTLWSLTWPRGSIRSVRIGRSVRYTADSIQDYIRERILCQTQPSPTTAA
jgi:excisionase family DNA binding protein